MEFTFNNKSSRDFNIKIKRMPFHLSKATGSHRTEHTSHLLCPNDLSAMV